MLDTVQACVPLDLAVAFENAEWRRPLSWPLPLTATKAIARQPLAGLADLIAASKGGERDILLLGGAAVAAFARQLLDAAATLDAARHAGVPVRSSATIGKAVSNDRSAAKELIRAKSHQLAKHTSPGNWLRRTGRVATWSTPARLLKALLSPDVLAISHNSMLIAEASRSPLAISFDYADSVLARGRRLSAGAGAETNNLAGRLVSAMTARAGLDASSLATVTGILRPVAESWLAGAASDLDALSRYRFGAGAIWSGTGGAYASRAIGLVAMAQGMRVRRYEHVGTGCFIADGVPFDITERVVSSEVFVPTADLQRFAENIRTPNLPLAPLLAGTGDPSFRFPLAPRPRSARPRVVYAATYLRGYFQYHSGLLPDAVLLDWQMRMAEALTAMPIELTIKPHPETRYPGGRDPLSAIANVSGGMFEALIPETDVFVFDFGQTTTFWKSLATAQPMVYLDMGLTDFQAEVWAALQKRATVIPVPYDQHNCPILDTAALRDAILGAKPPKGENPFVRWLGGSATA